MKKGILIMMLSFMSETSFSQIENRIFYAHIEAKAIIEGNWLKNKHLMYSETPFMRNKYYSYSKDTVTTYEVFDVKMSDNGFTISYSDELMDFSEAYESKKIYRIKYKDSHYYYVGVFKMKAGSKYDEIIISSEDVTRLPDRPNFKSAYSIAFRKGKNIRANHINNNTKDYSLLVID